MRAFLKAETGGILPFALVVSAAVILMGAMAVNTVRIDHKRSVTQSILDICVLNAAAQRQSLAPRTVFDDCLAKHDFDATITDFVAETGRSKSVTATAETSVESFFLAEPETYDLAVSSSASEELTNLEIVLALDVSNSLNVATPQSARPFDDLKAAANSFVQRMLQDDTQGRVHITILPYSSHVNLGADIAAAFNVQNAPQNLMINSALVGPDVAQKRCLDLPASAFSTAGVSPTTAIEAMPFVDIYGSTSQSATYVAPTNANFAVAQLQNTTCSFFRLAPSPSTSNVVRLPDFTAAGQQASVDTVAERVAALQAKINGLQVTGETAINLGMRWALAFLDPAARPVFSGFSAQGRMSQMAASLPLDYTDPTSIKVVVLMSDGTNTDEPRLRPQYARGPSPFWIGNDGNMSWFNSARPAPNQYWVPHNATWQAVPWRNATNTGAAARQMDYTEVWRRMKLTYVAWHFHARSVTQATTSAAISQRSTANTAALNEYRPSSLTTTAAMKDAQLQQSCNLARSQGVYVYSLLFQTVTTSSATLQACATQPAMSYVATSANLTQAFETIALHITRLQLDQ